MFKTLAFAICFLALLPAAHSQKDLVFSSFHDTFSDSLLVYTGTNSQGQEMIAVSDKLSAQELKKMVTEFSAQNIKMDELKRTIDDMSRDKENLQRSNEALSRKVEDMQRTIDKLERSINDLSSKIK